ncbi:MAG TPA: hypothetical protein VM053_07015 [Gemmatimonadaceae bacterium]|nr:hypothetical protein [Gemmatimonadaceae bacterium]
MSRSILSRAAHSRVTAALVGVLALAACSSEKILDVVDPDVATPASLEATSALPVVHAGAIGDFQVAFSGNTGSEGQVNMSGLFTDELLFAETFPTRLEVDKRQIQEQNSTMTGIMRDIQKARGSADFASTKFAAVAPGDIRRAETMNLAGFAIVIMGENYCSGIPLSRLTDGGEVVLGQPRTTAQLLDDAIAKFDSAVVIATAAGTAGTTQLNLARMGRGRALLNKGDFTGAAAAVTSVPTSFSYQIFSSAGTNRQNNGVWYWQRTSNRWTVANREGINGLPYISDADPRVPTVNANKVGFDGATPIFFQNKYPAKESPTPLATGTEARLIEAEAALRSANTGSFLGFVNAARAQQSLGAVALPATTRDQQDLLFKERAYALWLTSHRLGDMRRLVRQYNRTQDQVFPTGVYPAPIGGTYGTDVNFIIPFDEKNNNNFTGCLDRNA